ncbi:MAG TPA: hypothetical protein VFG03_09040 [Telluria sp.]|nr:hypothetical protein [Telluria sp.]
MLRLSLTILWPAFLAAGLAEGCLFSLFDPRELADLGGATGLAPLGLYTLAFFLLWICCALSGMLTYYLAVAPDGQVPSH